MFLLRGLAALARGVGSYVSLTILLSLCATIPILQFASLGYMLECSARMANNRPWTECFPGAFQARRLVLALAMIGLSWLPVWFVADLAYTAALIDPNGPQGPRLRASAMALTLLWIVWILWAAYRGGRLRDFLWPAPIRLLKSIFRPEFWHLAEDRLWSSLRSLHLFRLISRGFLASLGALIWLALPASLMILSLTGAQNTGKGILGLIGAIGMVWVVSRLPYVQVEFAKSGDFRSFLRVRDIRQAYFKSPWTLTISLGLLLVFATPLYILRIERIPEELEWILTLFFVLFIFPARIAIGWAWKRANQASEPAWWFSRYLVWPFRLTIVLLYVGALYLARFTSWEGAAVFLLQHAFLPPVPFFVR
ncbi:hypothetical protein VN12_17305 [Pirellula sp. SH-Sr6A]|uniref:hypothetical protein n=1 Tax=Pirellula sp. SH-Sr6A TaxID=1632865 RepID=UPI00078CF3BE|nr:hypothetical protein [Pirellula sp. SH-Sr6A]AMV33890.1 hypothetical protein VN12_17305 [Pirellula sp. SH-Sr6A]